jgi:hypothetical protein
MLPRLRQLVRVEIRGRWSICGDAVLGLAGIAAPIGEGVSARGSILHPSSPEGPPGRYLIEI